MNFGSHRGSRFVRDKKSPQDNTNPFNETNWIGAESHPETPAPLPHYETEPKPYPPSAAQTLPLPQARTHSPPHIPSLAQGSPGNKSPLELMQDLLKGTRGREEVMPYYSKES